ncbi:MAG: hypothetical protein IMY71_03225 [Bacteroidetes bacterium]|nr:hypothetical protein [Bacteroidota bacterium]
MASGRIAAVDMKVGINTLLYKMPTGQIQVLNVGISNRNDSDVKVRLAFVDGGINDLADSDYLEYNTVVRANGVLERSGIALAGEQSLIGYSDTGNVSFMVWG